MRRIADGSVGGVDVRSRCVVDVVLTAWQWEDRGRRGSGRDEGGGMTDVLGL